MFTAAAAQKHFKMTNASKAVDVTIDFPRCADQDNCGPVNFAFFRKGSSQPFQKIRVASTTMWDIEPNANETNLYDQQSTLNFGDFNFDGSEDVAVSDGNNGGYGGPSYRVYLYSNSSKRYVYSKAFTDLNQDGNLGFFEIDKKKKTLTRYTKDGCCWHQTQMFDVVRGRPRLVYELTEDAMRGDDLVHITTRKLISGRWRSATRKAKIDDYYKDK
jgi:hypothetical protein